ncbi:serine/threonine protein phosphatase PrpC [Desulfobotulus alkaliphilus]|uniref:Serine/threonine protein phosphatase PrpC n=1 Tax=Desulfobotulus alkaliphilus TaxID=622671 RepID=A0A562RQ85_9BACT|nr:protein phosphatase 2C domain-containing protein [Desulfobotulus alkaliphilus]TWI71198.1 serine/threonine protein phosphatase PrpC [Desulfobotulus alkaliphilus]
MLKMSYLFEKGTGTLNEDAIFCNGSSFGVFDGATSLMKTSCDRGLTGGFLAAHTAKDVFSNSRDCLVRLSEQANRAIYRKMLEHEVDTSDKSALWSTAAAVVRMKNGKLHWVQIGDSLILLIHKDGSFRIPVTDFNHDAETLAMWKKIADTSPAPIMDALGHQIRRVRCRMNVSYGVFNGEKNYASFLRSGVEELKDIAHVLLFTDGLFIPSENPSENRFDIMVRLYQEGGLSAVKTYVRTLEESDPECRRYPRFKTHDDIAALALDIRDGVPCNLPFLFHDALEKNRGQILAACHPSENSHRRKYPGKHHACAPEATGPGRCAYP